MWMRIDIDGCKLLLLLKCCDVKCLKCCYSGCCGVDIDGHNKFRVMPMVIKMKYCICDALVLKRGQKANDEARF